jgi:hypothetical protein
MQCKVCGRKFQQVARGLICCGMVLSLLVGKPPRMQPPTPNPIPEQVLRIAVSTSTASVSIAGPNFPFTMTKPPGRGDGHGEIGRLPVQPTLLVRVATPGSGFAS